MNHDRKLHPRDCQAKWNLVLLYTNLTANMWGKQLFNENLSFIL